MVGLVKMAERLYTAVILAVDSNLNRESLPELQFGFIFLSETDF